MADAKAKDGMKRQAMQRLPGIELSPKSKKNRMKKGG
jgi:hypothetical protein